MARIGERGMPPGISGEQPAQKWRGQGKRGREGEGERGREGEGKGEGEGIRLRRGLRQVAGGLVIVRSCGCELAGGLFTARRRGHCELAAAGCKALVDFALKR